jgi:hypothetical protein
LGRRLSFFNKSSEEPHKCLYTIRWNSLVRVWHLALIDAVQAPPDLHSLLLILGYVAGTISNCTIAETFPVWDWGGSETPSAC